MGLAASQARLLTITSRKSDCEYESMRLSHQKIALSREMNEISNDYQESLNQSKLYYDYYGTGDTSNPLTYSLLMTPSALNDYLPTILTNQQGRVVLSSKYANCARAAGIPQEGLNGLPSDDVRNAFVEALFTNGIISKKTKNAIQETPYNQAAGVGSSDMITVLTQDYTYAELKDYLKYSGDTFTIYAPEANYKTYLNIDGEKQTENEFADLSVYDLLCGDDDTYISLRIDNGKYPDGEQLDGANAMLEELFDEFNDYFSNLFDTSDGITANALSYATRQAKEAFIVTDTEGNCVGVKNEVNSQDEILGWANHHWKGGAMNTGHHHSCCAINLSNLLQAYLTYYADYMEGVASGTGFYDVVEQAYLGSSSLIGDDYVFTVVTGSTVSAEDAKLALFYDTLFNQLCTKGWTENDEVTDSDYMQEMLKSGMMYIATCGDDGYYYQESYSTNTFIKEISDDTMIAAAEARYKTMKAKITNKEDEIDLKMKNLDTEISSLTTEYDSVKSVINKNIERSFKRYNA